ncbi:MAG: hypothetical protein N3C12_07810 [Candidatus Binatia bacterium]|nr:hypothetical protein [Candidatus Binatia bacterium]
MTRVRQNRRISGQSPTPGKALGRQIFYLIVAIVALVWLASATSLATNSDDEIVAFNTSSLKYHCLKCEWALKCTRNCIKIKRAQAKASGGVPCKVCGGTCADTEVEPPSSGSGDDPSR